MNDELIYGAAGVAGVAILCWDWVVKAADYLLRNVPSPALPVIVPAPGPAKPKPACPTYQEAIADLASVRSRLVVTEGLTEQAKAAIDTLTLALVAGSDT